MYEGMRAEKLDQWEARLHAAYEGRAEDPIFIALARDGARARHPQAAAPRPALRLPPGHREAALRDVGRAARLLPPLRRTRSDGSSCSIFGYRDPELVALSDRICTALQLANHWQDLAVDLRRGRIYAPRELRDLHGVKEWDLNAGARRPRVHRADAAT